MFRVLRVHAVQGVGLQDLFARRSARLKPEPLKRQGVLAWTFMAVTLDMVARDFPSPPIRNATHGFLF